MTRSLLDEIRQRRPFQSLEQEAYLNIIRTAAILTDDLERMLKPRGITMAQYNVLRILRGADGDGLCRNEVRNRMLTRMPDVTRLLDRMESAGLVTRARDADDRRMVTTRITDQGHRMLDDLEEAVSEEHQRRVGRLSEARLGTLIELLSLVRDPVVDDSSDCGVDDSGVDDSGVDDPGVDDPGDSSSVGDSS